MNMTKPGELWASRTASERVTLKVAAVVLAVALYGLLVMSANQAREKLKSSIPALKVDAARLEQYGIEYERLKSMPTVPASTTDLRTLAQAQIAAAGLTKNLTKLDAAGGDQVQISLGDAELSNWLSLVATLQAQRVRLESAQITATSNPGLVSVNALLIRIPSQ